MLTEMLGDKVLEQHDELFRVAKQAMPLTMQAVLEEVRAIPGAIILSMEFVTFYRQPTYAPPRMFTDESRSFLKIDYQMPVPEIVLKTRIFLSPDSRVRTIFVSTLGLSDLHTLGRHLTVDTSFETYIGPYAWEQNWILKRDQ